MMRMTLLLMMLFAIACGSSLPKSSEVAADAIGDKVPESFASGDYEADPVEIGWIERIGDEVLVKLVDEALANNYRLEGAFANLDRARALAKRAGAQLTPTVEGTIGSASSGLVDGASDDSVYRAGLQASWEIDVWGRIRSGRDAAALGAEAVEADLLYAQHSLAAAVARAYFLVIEATRQQQTAKNSLDTLKEMLRIVEAQVREGMATNQDLALTRSDLARAEESLAQITGARRDAIRALESLMGRYPEADLSFREDFPEQPEAPPAGLPASLLERRPDLIAAERRIASSIKGVDVAKAARLPRISLTTNVGGSSEELSDVLDPTNVIWSLASNLLAPLIDGGARKADVEVATADQKIAVAAYADAALTAFGEVERALDQHGVLAERFEAIRHSRDEAAEALRLARLRFREGESGLFEVLQIQERFFARESALLSIKRARLDQFVDLNLALGGHW